MLGGYAEEAGARSSIRARGAGLLRCCGGDELGAARRTGRTAYAARIYDAPRGDWRNVVRS